MIDEIAAGLLRPLLRGVLYVLAEILWHGVCHVVGWCVIRALSVGRHPATRPLANRDSGLAEVVGALVPAAAGVAAASVPWR